MKKRGSLSLSVNAIVVFILAFAMLGVGLFFINMIREKLADQAGDVFNINQLKNPPTSDRPVVVSNEVEVKKEKSVKLELGYYNKEGTTAFGAHPVIKECRNEDNKCLDNVAGSSCQDVADLCAPISGGGPPPTGCLPTIASPVTDVPGGDGSGFKISLKEKGLKVNEEYICTLVIMASDTAGGAEVVKETESFHLSVVS